MRYWIWLSITAAALGGGAILGRWQGLAGMALGLISASFGIYALLLLIRLLEAGASGQKTGGFGVAVTLMSFAAKLPFYWVMGKLAQVIGGLAFGCFLAGIVLVYSSAVVWAAVAGQRSTNSPNGSPAD